MRRKLHAPLLVIAVCMSALWIAALAPAKMHSVRIAGGLCQTTGGKKIVPIPGFPGEKIDRRVLPDLKKLIRKYKLFVIDGYSRDPVHASNGEHPMGLAADLAPDFAHGGNWNLVDKLAHKAEPRQNQPVAPYRWVGYDGDAGHGRGNHLHLSWSHSELTGHRRFPKTVITKRCPVKRSAGNHSGSSGNDGGSNNGGGNHTGGGNAGHSGGVTPGSGGGKGGNGGGSHHGGGNGGGNGGSGGVGLRQRSASNQIKLAPPHPESASESVRN
ncbi:hypothetical protein BH10ACT11_BH10ACT11_04530 [soil metagenome]